ncbi:MAG: hypothetical protein EKK53_14695 [Burkholderiales bacterium]|nr:MAG: hypothetical protein EKK53_14695 [Burkholderiales bacterium]
MRAPPAPPRAAWLALAASLLAHAAMLGRTPARDDASRPARPLTVAVLAPPALPLPLPETGPTPLPSPTPRSAPREGTPPTPPRAQVVEAQAPTPDAPTLRLAGPAAWQYRLRQAGQDGEAQLDWRPEGDGRYSLRLTRRIGERTLPAWESLGRLGQGGLAPERFALQRGGQDRQAINFDADERTVSFSASPARLELPEGTQDRLSWWLQLAALVQAQPMPGGRWRVWVAGLRGELREWVFEAVDAAPEDAGTVHLRRLPLGERDPGIELWLDPARGYWPVRLRQGDPETRGFEIQLTGPAG